MKKVLLLLLFLNLTVFAQDIPNAGFENWTEISPGVWDPNDWPTYDFFWDAVQRTDDKYSGSYAAKLITVNIAETVEPAFLNSYFPATQHYGSLNGYIKFVPQRASDVITVDVILYSGSSFLNAVGSGSLESGAATSGFIPFTVPIEYFSANTPDSAWIFLIVEDTAETPAAGGYAIIDDLSWGAVVGVEKINPNVPSEFKMQQNYPNPFNPSTMIEYSIPKESFVELKVYDIVGNELNTLVSEYQPAGNFRAEFNAVNLSSGIYIAKLTAGSFTKSIKMTLLK